MIEDTQYEGKNMYCVATDQVTGVMSTKGNGARDWITKTNVKSRPKSFNDMLPAVQDV